MKLSSHKVGLITGLFISLLHAIWSLLVFLGIAQSLLDWILDLHFILNPYVVNDFVFSKAVILVVLTFAVGYVLGYVFTTIWNKMIKK